MVGWLVDWLIQFLAGRDYASYHTKPKDLSKPQKDKGSN
jgi:hypothetical protein